MDPQITASIIGGAATIIAPIVTGIGGILVGRMGIVDRLAKVAFPARFSTNLKGRWKTEWKEGGVDHSAVLEVTRHVSNRIYGHIEMATSPDKRWEIEGIFDGRFLQLFWYPSAVARDALFLDCGCYFFERQGQGFTGYGVGFNDSTSKIEISEDTLVPLTPK